ncbi:hypothetical protein LL240_00765 [Oceanimonas baumannii]|uniref:hypothetical protein n=1 Tax=Oceanimonas baumannii TaxID=129578 RepID=UPI001D184F93|nr:hypothetical protein [Oceanimonas baumannii]MCC4262990.1 hypothetical protein [Oceanimonas baumannii]
MFRVLYAWPLLLLTACAGAGDARLMLDPVGGLSAALQESSGLVALESGFISHNDSGHDAELFILDERGHTLQRMPVAAHNRDWEDIARHDNTLYIADTGNNGGKRRDLRVLALDLTPGKAPPEKPRVLPVRYREQHNFTPPAHQHNFDAEALTQVNDELWLLTKRWLDQYSAIYRVHPDGDSSPLTQWQRLNTQMLVTGADFDAGTQTLLLVGYSRSLFNRQAFVWLYPVKNNRVTEQAGRRFRLNETGQFEAITLGTDGHLYFTREGSAPRLFRSRQPLTTLISG